ncbi:hypothetical protein BDW59DRAFT_156164 [Aspergillus cavernicola]|uniref:C2H2-type domain-containing protein n=1 Tax=Aspergillus cavernicola TaxID=176166 RepID=A0ABR4J587_9EURO
MSYNIPFEQPQPKALGFEGFTTLSSLHNSNFILQGSYMDSTVVNSSPPHGMTERENHWSTRLVDQIPPSSSNAPGMFDGSYTIGYHNHEASEWLIQPQAPPPSTRDYQFPSYQATPNSTPPFPAYTSPRESGSYILQNIPHHTEALHSSPSEAATTRTETDPKSRFWCPWPGCNTSLGRKPDLERHMVSLHLSPRGYCCPCCGKSFNRKDNLSAHFLNVHGG